MSILSIQAISNACGVKAHTIRVWEKRYNLLNPQRTESGRRLYSLDDLEKLKMIQQLINQGHKISNLAKLDISELKTMSTNKNHIVYDEKESKAIPQLLEQLRNYDLEGLYKELMYLQLEYGAKVFILRILLPLFREIGQLVFEGAYSISQEHALSAITKDVLSHISYPLRTSDAPGIVLATPENNYHELGIVMANVLCRTNRMNTHFFGPNLPAASLAEATKAVKCQRIVLGCIYSDKFTQKDLLQYLSELDAHLEEPTEVYLGGHKQMQILPNFKHTIIKFAPTLEDLLLI